MLRAVAQATADERVGVLVRCYQGLEDPAITTERLFRLVDVVAFLHGEGSCRFHFPDRIIVNYHAALRTKPSILPPSWHTCMAADWCGGSRARQVFVW